MAEAVRREERQVRAERSWPFGVGSSVGGGGPKTIVSSIASLFPPNAAASPRTPSQSWVDDSPTVECHDAISRCLRPCVRGRATPVYAPQPNPGEMSSRGQVEPRMEVPGEFHLERTALGAMQPSRRSMRACDAHVIPPLSRGDAAQALIVGARRSAAQGRPPLEAGEPRPNWCRPSKL